jgi:hypothetical protein
MSHEQTATGDQPQLLHEAAVSEAHDARPRRTNASLRRSISQAPKVSSRSSLARSMSTLSASV